MLKMIFGLFAAGFSLVFLIVGVMAQVGNFVRNKRCLGRTTGTVIAIHTGAAGFSRPAVYTPEFRFTANGHSCTMKSSVPSGKCTYKVGQTVAIRFAPDNLQSAYVEEDSKASAKGGAMCVGIGLVLAFAAAILFV